VLQAACVTNTCQPQCREAAMNLYQNREGRQLLRTDTSCVPGRYELEKCGLLPNKSPKHCSFAKLICESDLQCNAKWGVFISECESETNEGRCSDKCRGHLNATLSTPNGADLASCTCTDKEDSRCVQLREVTIRTCVAATLGPSIETNRPLPRPGSMPPKPTDHSGTFPGSNELPEDSSLPHPGDMENTPASAPIATIGAAIFLSAISLLFARHCLF